jgi:hypothetical protein
MPLANPIRMIKAILFILLVYTSVFAGSRCQSFYDLPKPFEEIDDMESIGLKKVWADGAAAGYYFFKGYELYKAGPIFSDPEAVRDFVNRESFNRPFNDWTKDGQRIFEFTRTMGRKKGELLPIKAFAGVSRALLPGKAGEELEAYVKRVLSDAIRRGHTFRVGTITLRTEKYLRVPFGHFHNNESISYAKAEIGPNSEIHRLGLRTEVESEDDYLRIKNNDIGIMFGDAFHRSPPKTDGMKRLWIIVELVR